MHIPQIGTVNDRMRAIENTFDQFRSLSDWVFGGSTEGTNARMLSMQEDDASYILKYFIPATFKDSFSCELNDNQLEIRWSVHQDDIEKRKYLYPKIKHGNWRLNLVLPEDAKSDPGLAYDNEILTITFKKSAETKKRKIVVV